MKKLLSVFIFFSLFSCEQPKGEKADVSEAQKVKTPKPEALPYHLEASASEIRWTGSKLMGKHTGTIGIKEGTIEVLGERITGGKITINMDLIDVIDLKSDDDSHMKLTEHLRSNDFFDVTNHPYSIFDIIEVQPLDTSKTKKNKSISSTKQELPPTHKIMGNLTLRGKTLSIAFPAYVQVRPEKLNASATFVIDRTLWDVKYNEEAQFANKAQDQLIYNNVVVGFDITAYPNKETL